ncbi:hypothetical protein JTB14_016673 [Gonioctena quinquepunctata]|nr:hypothetical protein JTB14_016673 [Gonioctena quinquepunctata]
MMIHLESLSKYCNEAKLSPDAKYLNVTFNFNLAERLKRRTLKPKVVPSKKLPKLPHETDSGPSSKIPRTRQIQTSTTNEASPNNNEASEMFPLCENDGNVEDAQDIEAAEALLALLNSQNTAEVVLPGPSYRDSAVQTDCKTAKEVWETLKQIHTKYDTWHGLLLLEDFVNRAKKEDETINEYLTRRNGLYHKVKNAGFEFSETVQAGFAVLGLPNEYEYLARNLRADEDDLNMSQN